MQRIQWFPGHMAKAMRMMEENVKQVDAVIVVLDARAPISCVNPKLDKLFANRPVLYAINKSDLVEKQDINKIGEDFIKQGKQFISVVGTEKRTVTNLYNKVFSMLSEKLERYKAKGVFKPLRVMVAGVPNTGKSTLINTLCGSKKAITGDKAGVTKGKQWVRLNDLELLDTPGTMPPYFEDQERAKRLAFIGSINDEILDQEELALELIKDLSTNFKSQFESKYGIETSGKTPLEIYEDVCRRRGFLLRGNEFDYERCAKAVIDDFRKGRIGKICLDSIKIEQE